MKLTRRPLCADGKQQDTAVVAMTDDERSNTTTPLNPNAQDSGLGATDPPKGAAPDALRVASPPSPAIVPPEEEVHTLHVLSCANST